MATAALCYHLLLLQWQDWSIVNTVSTAVLAFAVCQFQWKNGNQKILIWQYNWLILTYQQWIREIWKIWNQYSHKCTHHYEHSAHAQDHHGPVCDERGVATEEEQGEVLQQPKLHTKLIHTSLKSFSYQTIIFTQDSDKNASLSMIADH